MKTIVTGGSGYLGTHLRTFFHADDLSRRSGRDILNTQDAQIVSEYDVVIHLAAYLDKSPEASEQVFLTNVEGTINLLRNIKKDAVFIFASTKDVYGRFADNYAEVPETCPTVYSGQSGLEWSKLIAERYVEYYAHQNGFRSCIFRLSTVYAPKSEGNMPNFVGHYADAINFGECLALPGRGTPRRDLLHVNDLAVACQAFIGSVIRHGLYNIGGGSQNAVSLRELVRLMEEVSGLQAVLDEETEIPVPTPLNYVSDLTLVTQELGWRPNIPIIKGLNDLWG
ncbi:NAD-dependent epimerase/dehydratase family protein [Leptolyngbya sp. 7M]|uniref:NAD-dependent epimerase/dehydratase family protein n=1 Tax=Leptolyngbya sp. 7M TaxID=2812896 RepID=UPI001B8D6E48|nr:NAD-dependent epimerase/dehydratase family protein [Leptolyngbya sp. 7M]QYO66124.1 NAD-dependent epimerase/dehydratase family protein [Leptolyngbya sp. 7M]